MKICTRMKITDGQPGEILDVSVVGDDHPFGLTPDGSELHSETSTEPVIAGSAGDAWTGA